MRVFSNGGGVQSTAALILSAQGRIDFKIHLFCNVGDDSENPDTITYVTEWLRPYADAKGIEFHHISRSTNDGETLYQRLLREDRSIGIPVRMKNGAPGSRNCTMDYKRQVVRKWLGKGDHIVGLGISMDEFQRMRSDSGFKNISNEYPLIDLRLSRNDCLKIIADAGLPKPPKSSCWFCPYHNTQAWQDLRRTNPELFDKAVQLEVLLNEKRAKLDRDPVYLSAKGRSLDKVVGDQPFLFDPEDSCESGYCMV